jgi:hypothetical protein
MRTVLALKTLSPYDARSPPKDSATSRREKQRAEKNEADDTEPFS